MGDIKKYDETDIYLLDKNDMELDNDIDIIKVDDITLKRITQATLNRVVTYEAKKDSRVRLQKNGVRRWFALQTRVRKISAIILCFTVLCGVTVGCITLIRQYVPGHGIVSSSSKLKVLASPYTVWKDDYYLRITSLSYNPDTKILNFTAESNGTSGYVYDVGERTVFGYMHFMEKQSQSMPEGSTGKTFYHYGTPLITPTVYHDEYKLKKEPGDYYLEFYTVDVSYDENGDQVYTEKSDYIIIPFGDLKLVPSIEADGLEDFGKTVESNGISVVAASRWEKGKLYTDILFESSNSNENVISFNTNEDSDVELLTDDNRTFKSVGGHSPRDGWKYLIFETDESVNGTVSLNSLFIEKSVDKSIKLDMPKVGETIILNKEVVIDGIKIMLEYIKAYNVVLDEKGNVLYTLPDNDIRIEVKCRIIKGISNGRIADEKSYLLGNIMAGNVKDRPKGAIWGSDGIFIFDSFDAEHLKNISEITLVINDIMLTVEGNWEIPIKVK